MRSVLCVCVVSGSAGVEKLPGGLLIEASLPPVFFFFGEPTKGLFWLVGDGAFNSVSVCV